LLFIKAAKVIGFAMIFSSIAGCAVGTGLIYSSLIRGCAYAPEMEDAMFNYASLGFAFVETFCFILIGAGITVLVL